MVGLGKPGLNRIKSTPETLPAPITLGAQYLIREKEKGL